MSRAVTARRCTTAGVSASGFAEAVRCTSAGAAPPSSLATRPTSRRLRSHPLHFCASLQMLLSPHLTVPRMPLLLRCSCALRALCWRWRLRDDHNVTRNITSAACLLKLLQPKTVSVTSSKMVSTSTNKSDVTEVLSSLRDVVRMKSCLAARGAVLLQQLQCPMLAQSGPKKKCQRWDGVLECSLS
ncbi:hypothetical protein HDK77DRAFT_213528 [Phyllosticta capitalensis]